MASNLTGQHRSKVPSEVRVLFELLKVCPVWIKSNGVTYNVRGSK